MAALGTAGVVQEIEAVWERCAEQPALLLIVPGAALLYLGWLYAKTYIVEAAKRRAARQFPPPKPPGSRKAA